MHSVIITPQVSTCYAMHRIKGSMSKTDSIPRHDYRGFASPKAARRKKSVKAEKNIPESTVQAAVDFRLECKSIPYLRLTATLLNTFFNNPMIPVHVKKIISDELAGWPDNICLLPVSGKYCLCCLIENKSTEGKLHGRQKLRASGLPFNIIRSDQEAEAIIKDFELMAGLVSEGIRMYEEKKILNKFDSKVAGEGR